MMYAIPVSLGLIALAMTIYFVIRNTSASRPPVDLDEFLKSLLDLRTDVVAEAQIERVLSREDWEYAARAFPSHLQRIFYEERKAIVIRWLRQTRKSVVRLHTQYKGLVRLTAWLLELLGRIPACSGLPLFSDRQRTYYRVGMVARPFARSEPHPLRRESG